MSTQYVPALKIETGKTYVKRDGALATIVGKTIYGQGELMSEEGVSYNRDGRWAYAHGHESDEDLVREHIIEPVVLRTDPILTDDGYDNPVHKSILEEATTIIYGDREKTYGHPSKNLERIAQQWSLYIDQKFNQPFKTELTPEDVCWMMMSLKMVRQMNSKKRDNLVDAAGYLALIERCDEKVS